MVDEDIIIKLNSGDEDAMILLYKNYWRDLYISAYKVLKDKDACEDIVQELFISVWNNRTKLKITVSLKAYLAASIRHEVYRRIRTMKQYEPIAGDALDIASGILSSDNTEYKDLQRQIALAVENLPDKCREVFQLSRYEQLSHKEISARLSISTNTVRNHLAKAIQLLRINVDRIFFFILLFFLYK